MGIHDRDYYREQEPSFFRPSASSGSGSWASTAVGTLIIINLIVYAADALFSPTGSAGLINYLVLPSDAWTHPLQWYRFVTCGFAHEAFPKMSHVLFNMVGLFFLGPAVENRYGRREFFRFYLFFVLVGSIGWVGFEYRTQDAEAQMDHLLGASGAVVGVVILFALNFPRMTVYLLGVVPIRGWALGVGIAVMNVLQALGASADASDTGSHVAYSVHLLGAAAAVVYFVMGWNFGAPASWVRLPAWPKRRPKLRIHDPSDPDAPEENEDSLSAELDAVLEKLHRSGMASLSRKERRILEKASREYQQRRQNVDQ